MFLARKVTACSISFLLDPECPFLGQPCTLPQPVTRHGGDALCSAGHPEGFSVVNGLGQKTQVPPSFYRQKNICSQDTALHWDKQSRKGRKARLATGGIQTQVSALVPLPKRKESSHFKGF